MSSPNASKRFGRLGLLLLWSFVGSVTADVFARGRGYLTPFGSMSVLLLLLMAFFSGFVFLRSKFKTHYKLLPSAEQLKIDIRSQQYLGRMAKKIKRWMIWLTIITPLGSWMIWDEGPQARVIFGIAAVGFFTYSVVYLRSVNKGMRRLSEKLLQSEIGGSSEQL